MAHFQNLRLKYNPQHILHIDYIARKRKNIFSVPIFASNIEIHRTTLIAWPSIEDSITNEWRARDKGNVSRAIHHSYGFRDERMTVVH